MAKTVRLAPFHSLKLEPARDLDEIRAYQLILNIGFMKVSENSLEAVLQQQTTCAHADISSTGTISDSFWLNSSLSTRAVFRHKLQTPWADWGGGRFHSV